jgi:SAM-dependent methyltransferase
MPNYYSKLFTFIKVNNLPNIIKKIFVILLPNIFGSIKYKKYFKNKNGLEIGGPSSILKFEIPIYPVIKNLDSCNFSSITTWEGNISEGSNFNYFKNKCGFQFISEATDLHKIADETYDFVIASHCLEHCANPIKAIKEWLRVIKKGAYIFLILPDPKFTFDTNRPITTLQHLINDYNLNTDETDLTHLDEILNLHDLNKDHLAGTKDIFHNRCLNNFHNRCMHHHVFDIDLLKSIFNHLSISIEVVDFLKPHHLIILGTK